MFNSSALPRFNTGPSKSTDFHGFTRSLTWSWATNNLAVDGEPSGWTRPSVSTKFQHCSAFWTKASGITENLNGFWVHQTFEWVGGPLIPAPYRQIDAFVQADS